MKDGIGLAGLASLCGGLWMVYPPLAPIVGGVLLIGLAVILSIRAEPKG